MKPGSGQLPGTGRALLTAVLYGTPYSLCSRRVSRRGPCVRWSFRRVQGRRPCGSLRTERRTAAGHGSVSSDRRSLRPPLFTRVSVHARAPHFPLAVRPAGFKARARTLAPVGGVWDRSKSRAADSCRARGASLTTVLYGTHYSLARASTLVRRMALRRFVQQGSRHERGGSRQWGSSSRFAGT